MIDYISQGRRVNKHYTDSEKLSMIQEYLTTDVTMEAMCAKYHIGHSSITRWMAIFGMSMPERPLTKMPMVQKIKPEEKPAAIESLEAQLKELRAELEHEKLKNLALNTMIDVAGEELHVGIRKKAGAKQ